MNEKDAVFEVALSLWRQKWVALIVFVLCAIPPVLWVVQLADDYTANATVHIAPMPGLDPDNRSTQHVYIDQVSLKTGSRRAAQ